MHGSEVKIFSYGLCFCNETKYSSQEEASIFLKISSHRRTIDREDVVFSGLVDIGIKKITASYNSSQFCLKIHSYSTHTKGSAEN